MKSLVARVSESTARRAHDKTVTLGTCPPSPSSRFDSRKRARETLRVRENDGKRDVVTLKDVEPRARRAASTRATWDDGAVIMTQKGRGLAR